MQTLNQKLKNNFTGRNMRWDEIKLEKLWAFDELVAEGK